MGIRLLVAAQQPAFSIPPPLLSNPSARQHQSSPTSAPQGLEKDSSGLENLMTTGIKFGRCSSNESRSFSNLENVSTQYSSRITSSSLRFNLLNENVDMIEYILDDINSVRLERDILIHIRRLGALKLFNACLSRTLMPSSEVRPNSQPTDLFRYYSKECPVLQGRIAISSGKKEERKLRRSRAKEKNCLDSSQSSNHKRISILLDTLESKSRLTIARNEIKLSIAVKDVACLERIRLKLEKESGEEVSLERWAEAAGIDLKTLHQRLLVGWHSREKLIRSSRTLVIFLARNYKEMGVALEDLLQAGSMGVLKGAERFDCSRGYRFSTYAQYWIRKSILSLITRYSRGIYMPATTVKIIKTIQDASRFIRMRKGKFPEDDEIADLTNLPLATIRLARRCSRSVSSLGQWQIADLMEMTPDTPVETPFEFVMKQEQKRKISELLESLHPRERQVLLLRYGLDDGRSKSLGEIGSLCNVSKEWIRRIERSAMKNIRSRDIKDIF